MNVKYIGHTLNISHGFLTVVDYAVTLKANFIQIFLSNPQQYGGRRRSQTELQQLNQRLTNNNVKMVIHANFKLNFCNPENSYIHKAAINDLVSDLKDSVIIGAIGVVIHMGKNVKKLNLSDDDAIKNYVKGIKTALSKSPINSIVILETGAGVGTEVCTSIFDLGKLFNMFTTNEQARLKFCIDTCHIFASGYHIGDCDYVDVFCNLIDLHLKWNNVACIHLNDSKTNVNSHVDNHADLGKGFIGNDGLKKFVRICANKNVPIVLETPCETLSKKDQIGMVKEWINE